MALNLIIQDYQIGPFESRRDMPMQKGKEMEKQVFKSQYIDNVLGTPLNMVLTERIDYRKGTAKVFAQVSYNPTKIEKNEVKMYLNEILKGFQNAGRIFF